MKTKYILIAVAFLLACLSCSKMNDNIDQYLSQGEITYLARPDSVKLFPGRERFLTHFWVRDPRVSEMRIYWSMKKDSLCVPIPETRDKQAPIAVRNCKKAINDGLQVDIDQALVVEEALFGDCFESWDQQEGMANFLRKKDDPQKVKVVAFQNK